MVTEPRSQGGLGLCWAFASNASFESYLLKNIIHIVVVVI